MSLISFMSTRFRMLTRFRSCIPVGVVVAVVATFLTALSPAQAADRTTPVVGSFAVGDSGIGDVDERTGTFTAQLPLMSLPGLNGKGAADVGVSYRQELSGINRFGLGKMWGWSETFVDTDGGVRVFPTSGGVFTADSSHPTGLDRYVLGDVNFTQHGGVLPARENANAVEYAFMLAYTGGFTDYFSASGDHIARNDQFGNRTDWVWEAGHRLVDVIDAAGNRTNLVWDEAGVTLRSPTRSDDKTAITRIEISNGNLISVTHPTGEVMYFEYRDDDGFVDRLITETGAITEVSYQTLADKSVVVDQIRVVDSATNEVLSMREWDVVGEHTSSGWPIYSESGALSSSGDGQFRYRTQLSDGVTHVISEYNSMGLMISRDVVLSTEAEDVTAQTQEFTYLGTEKGGVPDPQVLPKQYQKPTKNTTVFRNSTGHTRYVSEETVFDDQGRIIKQVSTEGTVTETVYDDHVPPGMVLPVGVMIEQTVTGIDGTVSKTVNTVTPDYKAIQATEKKVGSGTSRVNDLVSTSRTEFTVESDGFICEKRVTAKDEVNTTSLDSSDSSDSDGQTDPGGQSGPAMVVTRFTRTVDPGTVTVAETNAAGTSAASTVSSIMEKATGLTLSTTDAVGRVAHTTYDMAGRVLTTTNEAGLTTLTEHGDKVTRVTNPQGIIRSEYVNVLGQIVKITDNIRNGVAEAQFERVLETRTYEQNSSKIISTDVRGLETTTVLDVFGRPVKIQAPNGIRQLTVYDDVANTVTTGLVAGSGGLENAERVSTTVKDNKDRVVEENGTRVDKIPVPTSTKRYDGLGRIAQHTSEDISANVVFNPDGTAKTTQLTPENPDVFPGEQVTADRQHTVWGAATKKTLSQQDGEKREGVSRVFDAAGQVVSETDQTGNITVFKYTQDGLVTQTEDQATGDVTHNTYDPVTRALVMKETRAPQKEIMSTSFEYDPITGKKIAIFDPTDRAGTQIRYTYDIFGNTTEILYPDGKAIHHIFDEFGRKIATNDIAGNVTTYEYDRFGLLVHVIQASPENTILGEVRYTYDDFGRIVKLVRGNTVTTEYTFTSANAIKTEKTTRNSTVIHNASYEYDAHGNVKERQDTRPEISALEQEQNSPLVTETSVYTYDAYNRLISSAVYGGTESAGEPRLRTDYQISVSGDVTQEIVTKNTENTGATKTVRDFEYNALGQLASLATDGVRVEQQYDAAGNLINTVDGTRYTYNAVNKPVKEIRADGSAVRMSYWITGDRKELDMTHKNDMSRIGMYWDGDALVNNTYTDVAGGENMTASYLIGISRHTRTLTSTDHENTPTDTDYYITDRHGNVTALTKRTGEISSVYTYNDYGHTTTKTVNREDVTAYRNPFTYAGEYTTDTGTQYLGARIYDPTVMRFTTHDTADLHNLYAYGNANPIIMSDPTGERPSDDSPTPTHRVLDALFNQALWMGLDFFMLGKVSVALKRGSTGLGWITGLASNITGICDFLIRLTLVFVGAYIPERDAKIIRTMSYVLLPVSVVCGGLAINMSSPVRGTVRREVVPFVNRRAVRVAQGVETFEADGGAAGADGAVVGQAGDILRRRRRLASTLTAGVAFFGIAGIAGIGGTTSSHVGFREPVKGALIDDAFTHHREQDNVREPKIDSENAGYEKIIDRQSSSHDNPIDATLNAMM